MTKQRDYNTKSQTKLQISSTTQKIQINKN